MTDLGTTVGRQRKFTLKPMTCRICPFEGDCVSKAVKEKTFTPPAHCPHPKIGEAEPSKLGERDGGELWMQ